jgi:hypothetical protein
MTGSGMKTRYIYLWKDGFAPLLALAVRTQPTTTWNVAYSVDWPTQAINTSTVTTIPSVRIEPPKRGLLTERIISDSTYGYFIMSVIQNGPWNNGEFQHRISARAVASVIGR